MAGFLLGVLTISLQLHGILADTGERASRNSQIDTSFHATQAAVKKKLVAIQVTPALAGRKKTTTLSLQATMATVEPAILPVVNQPGIHEDQKMIADTLLRLMPNNCAANLKSFYVRYDNPTQRGLAGKSTVIISGAGTLQEFAQLLGHELLGHFYDLGCLTGTPASGTSEFSDGSDPVYNDDPSLGLYRICFQSANVRNSRCKDSDFVTGYAKTDVFEYTAETINYRLFQRDAFRERAKTNPILAEQLAWADAHMPVTEEIGKGTMPDDGKKLPWDSTRIPATAIGSLAAMIHRMEKLL
ncbi:MAG: hypothetical protein JWM56_675 [Candidatus Peribacteria bacterium]|nr:hypothetical protein [Candidatus Peribacteria bacterium]